MFLSSGTFSGCGGNCFTMSRFEPGPGLEVWQSLQGPFCEKPVPLTVRKSDCPAAGFPPLKEPGRGRGGCLKGGGWNRMLLAKLVYPAMSVVEIWEPPINKSKAGLKAAKLALSPRQ